MSRPDARRALPVPRSALRTERRAGRPGVVTEVR